MSELVEGVEPEDEIEPGGRRLTPAEWAEACELWNMAEVATFAELAARYGISATGLSKGLKKRGATHGSKKKALEEAAAKAALEATRAATAKTTAAAIVEEATFASLRKGRIEETKTQHYDWITMIGKLTMAELVKAQRAGEAFANVGGNLKALRNAAAIITMVRDERYTLLEAYDEVDEKSLPELVIRDLTENELETLRARNDDDDGLVIETDVELPAGLEDVVLEGDDGVS